MSGKLAAEQLIDLLPTFCLHLLQQKENPDVLTDTTGLTPICVWLLSVLVLFLSVAVLTSMHSYSCLNRSSFTALTALQAAHPDYNILTCPVQVSCRYTHTPICNHDAQPGLTQKPPSSGQMRTKAYCMPQNMSCILSHCVHLACRCGRNSGRQQNKG